MRYPSLWRAVLACTSRGAHQRRWVAAATPPWRPAVILDEWVQKEARPISLRQLTFFGRSLTENRLFSSANYVRNELPTRLAHRLRDMQTLPFVVVTNPHMSHVYELYYKAFEILRRVPEIKTIEDNDRYCTIISNTLQEHLTVIPRLAMGVIECQEMMQPEQLNKFMNTLLRARISRRVIAEQHLALTDTFHSHWHFADTKHQQDPSIDFVGEVFLRCNAREVIAECGERAKDLARAAYGRSCVLPGITLEGHLDATFPYILSHLQYIVGELLRNSIQAVMERQAGQSGPVPPIQVLICEAPQHVIIRISDQGGGIPNDVLPDLWSFGKGPRSQTHLRNLLQVPKMAATMQELRPSQDKADNSDAGSKVNTPSSDGSLSSLTSRPPELRLGIGLPMSRVYAEYWAGSLELHSLEGYGCDAFLQISKLGNKNEQLSTRASMDAYGINSKKRYRNASTDYRFTPAPLSYLVNVSNQRQSWSYSSSFSGVKAAPAMDLLRFGEPGNPSSPLAGSFGEKSKLFSNASFPHRRPSKNYGNLFNLRPRSPPLSSSPCQHKGFHLSPGKYIEDTALYFPSKGNVAGEPVPVQGPRAVDPTGINPKIGPDAPQHEEPLTQEAEKPSESSTSDQEYCQSFSITGLALSYDWTDPLGVYLPAIKPYASVFERDPPPTISLIDRHNSEPVEHIDICTIWKGLSVSEAEQLVGIHRMFNTAISSLVSSQLTDLPVGAPTKPWLSDTGEADDTGHGVSRCLTLSPTQLVSRIKQTLATQGQLTENELQTSTEKLINLYLANSDCFIINNTDNADDCAINTFIRYRKPEADREPLTVSIVAGWYPEFLSFSRVDFRPREGQELIIVPHYRCSAFSTSLGCQGETRFSLESPVPWLQWDDCVAGWRGNVPPFSELSDDQDYCGVSKTYRAGLNGPYVAPDLLRIEVKAVRIERVRSVRVERSVRARLTIKVLPILSNGSIPGLQATSTQREAIPGHRGPSRANSKGSLDGMLEPSVHVSPKIDSTLEICSEPENDQHSPPQRSRTTRSLDFERVVTTRLRKGTSNLNKEAGMFEVADPATPPIPSTNHYKSLGLSMPEVPQIEPKAPAASVKRSPDRVGSPHDQGSPTTRHSATESEHQPQELQSFFRELRECMSNARKALASMNERKTAALCPARERHIPVIPTQAFHRDITVTSQDCTEVQNRLQREGIIQPASAELLALAESLHKGPCAQEQNGWEGSKAFEPEESLINKQHESENPYDHHDSIPFGYDLDDGALVPMTPSSQSINGLSKSPLSPLALHNRFDILNTLGGENSFDTDPDIENEENPNSYISSSEEIIVDSDVDPAIRKEQALLWSMLSKQPADAIDNEKLSADERKQLFEATKQSWATEERRLSNRLGINLSADFSTSEGPGRSDSAESEGSNDGNESDGHESGAGSETIHAGNPFFDCKIDPEATSKELEEEDGEPKSGCLNHSACFRSARIEDQTSESSLGSSESDPSTSGISDDGNSLGISPICRALKKDPAAAPPSSRNTLPSNPYKEQSPHCIEFDRGGHERGRTRSRMPLMGLFGSASRRRGPSARGRGNMGKRCSGFGCESSDGEYS